MYDSGPNWTRLIRTIGIVLVLIVLPIIVMSTSCTRIDAGHVGIRVKMTGSNRGVQRSPVTTGWVFVNPITEKIVEFPTKVLNIVWTRDVNDGSPQDESLTFASQEGVSINADVGLAFHIQPSKAPRLYERFREDDVLTLAHGYVRSAVREALNEGASQMAVQQIYGPGKTELLNDALARLNKKLAPDGFIIDQLTFSSALRLPDNVVGAINRAMEAT